MKSLWNSFKIAFSMFSKIPMPQAEWTEENMKIYAFFSVHRNGDRYCTSGGRMDLQISGVRKFIYGNGTGSCASDPHGWNSYRRTSGYFGCLKFLA